jgi:hypothetical protein
VLSFGLCGMLTFMTELNRTRSSLAFLSWLERAKGWEYAGAQEGKANWTSFTPFLWYSFLTHVNQWEILFGLDSVSTHGTHKRVHCD